MTKRNKILFVASSLLCLIPIFIGILLYDKLPDMIPIHWNTQGEIDGYATKFTTVFLLPAFIFAIDILVKIITLFDPKNAIEANKHMKVVITFILPIISLLASLASFTVALGNDININTYVFTLIGILFILLGNYMPKTKQNYTIGVKTPWTLSSEYNWNKTHRLSGFTFTIAGFLFLLSAFMPVNAFFIIIIITITILLPLLYSFLLYKKYGDSKDNK